MPIIVTVIFVLLTFSLFNIAISAPGGSNTELSVITYTASPEGFMSNSHILTGENEALLIDAQFSGSDGRKVAELIKSTGKELSGIIITHPHPDHYYGLEVLGMEFGDAEITGGPETIAGVRNTSKYWTGADGKLGTFSDMTVMQNGSLKLEDIEIVYRIFRGGESFENTVIYLPSSQTLFIGDLASSGVHMWVGENNVDKWIEQLRGIRSIGPIVKVYPGHGTVGGPNLLEQAEKYLLSFKESVNNSETIDEAVTKMKKLYPDYKMPQILEGSVRAVMWPGSKPQ